MIHQPLGGAQGQATEIEIAAKRILSLRDKLNQVLAERTGQPIEVIERDTDRDNFKTAEEALQYGLIDKVLTRNSEEQNNHKTNRLLFEQTVLLCICFKIAPSISAEETVFDKKPSVKSILPVLQRHAAIEGVIHSKNLPVH